MDKPIEDSDVVKHYLESRGEVGTLAAVHYIYSTEGQRIIFDDKEHLDWYVKLAVEDFSKKVAALVHELEGVDISSNLKKLLEEV